MKKETILGLLVMSILLVSVISFISLVNASSFATEDLVVICKRNKGCWDEEDFRCYGIGYREGHQYCSEKAKVYAKTIFKSGFVNQTKVGEICINNYECETNICLEGICINITEEINRQVNIKFEELKQELNDNVEDLNESDKNIHGYVVESENDNISTERGIVKRILSWFKRVFSWNKNDKI